MEHGRRTNFGAFKSKSVHYRAGFNWWEAWGEIKIEGFGGMPPFGGRPGALGPMSLPLNPALVHCVD